MMSRNLYHIFFYMLVVAAAVFACDTPGSVEPQFKNHFIKYYGGDGDQEANDMIVTSDNGVIMIGTTSLSGGTFKRVYAVKTDFEGTVLWEKIFGSAFSEEVAQDIELITHGSDAGNFAVLSNVRKNPADSAAIRLTIISTNGDSIKSVLFNQLESQRGKSVTPLTDGGYYITGNTTDTDPSDAGNASLPITDVEDQLVIKYADNFVGIQADRIGSSSMGYGIKIFEGLGNNFYEGYSDELTTLTGPDNTYDVNFTFRNVTPGGASGTPSGYAGTDTDSEELAFVTRSLSGTSYLAVGTQTVASNSFLYASVLSTNFSVSREGVIGSDIEAVSACATTDGQYFIVGNSIQAGSNRNIWVAKVNSLLTVTQIPVEFGGQNNDDTASAVAELPNGDILILGTMNLVNQHKIALIKLKANGTF